MARSCDPTLEPDEPASSNLGYALGYEEMIDYLTAERGLSLDDAYMVTSAAVDLHITQVVDGVKGVHAMLPKTIFEAVR